MARRTDSGIVRAAIYTRKSTEEGLEQAFNSLDAQREACAAYILSQRHEGWALTPELYDDGGFSGGNMDRPGLKHLLDDVKAGKVDVIVVYKVDRLTRSLADFAKIVEVLDAQGASFVSVTQAFNTTTSMGRLTLNVLLSFAQFEREVTGERIRDKIAASKARGMWMGGMPPLGYRVEERKLVVAHDDAAKVRMIFQRYLMLGSVTALKAELDAAGIGSRIRTSRTGKQYGGASFSRGALYLMLQNRTYLGEVTHKGNVYPGEHQPIVEASLFTQVSDLLALNLNHHKTGKNFDHPSLLVGRVWDGEGRRMSPDHATKGSKRYRYYATRAEDTSRKRPAWRVPAGDLEAIVINQIRLLVDIEQQADVGILRQLVEQFVDRVSVHSDRVEIIFGVTAQVEPITSIPASLLRRGREMRLAVPPTEDQVSGQRDPSLIKLLVRAHQARDALENAAGLSVAELAAQQGYTRDYYGVLLRIAYLAPDIVAAVLDGRQPLRLNRQRLARLTNLPIDWREQREMLGFS